MISWRPLKPCLSRLGCILQSQDPLERLDACHLGAGVLTFNHTEINGTPSRRLWTRTMAFQSNRCCARLHAPWSRSSVRYVTYTCDARFDANAFFGVWSTKNNQAFELRSFFIDAGLGNNSSFDEPCRRPFCSLNQHRAFRLSRCSTIHHPQSRSCCSVVDRLGNFKLSVLLDNVKMEVHVTKC